MATQGITGAGEIQLRDPVNNILLIGGFASVELTSKVEKSVASRYNKAGKLIISDTWEKSSEYELKLNQEVVDSLGFGLGMGEVPMPVTSTGYYDFIEAVVPLVAPFEVQVPTLITTALANGTSVQVTMQASGVWNSFLTGQKVLNMTVLQTGAAVDGSVVVTTTAVGTEKLVFHSSQAGAPVTISYLKTVATKLTLGIQTVAVKYFGSLYFSAKLISDEFPNGLILICPSVSKNSGLAYKTGEVSPIENTFTCGTPAGSPSPVQMIFL